MGLLRKLLDKLHKKSVEPETFVVPQTPESFVVPSSVEIGEDAQSRPPVNNDQLYQDESLAQQHNWEIEQRIIDIQRSTKVNFHFLAKLHNHFRQRYSWYYKWHLSPWSSFVNIISLAIFIVLVAVFASKSMLIKNPKQTYAFAGDNAVDMLGQIYNSVPNYTKDYINGGADAKGFTNSANTVVDTVDHRLFVSDSSNNRVLVFNLDSSNNLIDHIADNVLGQPDFQSNMSRASQSRMYAPRGLAYDSVNKRLFVADTTNQRVLVFDVNSITDGENAVNVLGQTSYTSATGGTAQNKFSNPYELAYDSVNSRLFVSDYSDHRVLVFNVSSITNGQNAANVLGQPDYGTVSSGTTQSKLYYPTGLAYDDGATVKRLFVADRSNNRLMVFDVTAITDGENAINVLGQTDYITGTSGTTQAKFINPWGVAYDQSTARLFVGATGNNRILVFDVAAITDGENAVNVLGQTAFNVYSSGLTQAKLNYVEGLSFGDNKLFAADYNNQRQMIFDVTAITDGENAVDGLGQLDGSDQPVYTTNAPHPAMTADNFSSPRSTVIDSTNHRLYVSDNGNSRVLVYNLNTNNQLIDHTADYVLGQPDLTSRGSATAQNRLNAPNGLALDSANNRLFVVDTGNYRVMVFDVATITNGENAVNVLGQSTFTTVTASLTQAGLNNPYSVAYQSSTSRLFVADYSNNRILVFDVAAITDGENAINVLGQTTFTANSFGTTQSTLYYPRSVVIDDNNNRLFVADYNNYRVLVFDIATISDGENAINVLGQASFTVRNAACTQNRMGATWGLGYDPTYNILYVSDISYPRILAFDVTTITDGENAIEVWGQSSFTTGVPGTAQDRVWSPAGISYDATNKLLVVADAGNNRIMYFAAGNRRYWVASSAGNWSDTANWSTYSGGPTGASVPGSGDIAIIDGANSKNGNVTLTGTLAIDTFDVQAGYTGTIAQGSYTITTATLFNLSGGQPLVMGADITANGSLVIGAGRTLDTNGHNLVKSGTPVGACSGANITNNGTIKAADAINLTLCNETDSGTIEYSGTGGNIMGGDYYNLTLSGNAAWSHINAVSGNWNVNGTFSLSGGSFGMSSGETLAVKGGFSQTGGTFDSSNGDVTFMANSSSAIAFGSTKFSTLTFDNETGNNTTLTLSGNATITTTLTVKNTSSGNLSYTVAGSANPTLSVSGNLDFPATAQTGAVAFGKSGSNFTVNIGGNLTLSDPNATLSAISNYNGSSGDTKALLHFNGSDTSTTFTDSGGPNSWSASAAGPVLKTTTPAPKFGSAAYYNSSANYLTAADSADFRPGTGDFTIDTWMKRQGGFGPVDIIGLFNKYQDSSNYYKFAMSDMPYCSAGSFRVQFIAVVGGVTKADYTTPCLTLANDAWHHFAAVRNGSTFYIFFDGTSQTLTTGTAISTNSIDNTGAERIGEQTSLTSISIDEFRFSRSAKWTASFTVPTAEYSASLSGSDNQTISQSSTINGPMIINKTAGSVSLSTDLTSTYTDANLNGNLTLTQGTLDANSHTLGLGGDYAEAAGSCSGLAGFSAAGFALSGGTFTAPSAMTIAGDYNKTGGTFTHSSGTVTLNKASGTQTLNSGGTGSGNDFYNLTHSGNGTLQLITSTVGVAHDLINSAGVLDGNNQSINIAGDLTSSASLLMGSGTWDTEGNVDFTGGTVTSGTSTLKMSNTKNLVGNSAALNNLTVEPSPSPQFANSNLSPTNAVNDSGISGSAWSGLGNVYTSNDSYATVSAMGPFMSQYIKSNSYGFNVPSNATITGIEAHVEKKAANVSGSCSDNQVRIVKSDGTIGTTNKPISGSWATSDTASTYGGSADSWGETWTPAAINDADFGFALSANIFGNMITMTCYVDHIDLTVYYTSPSESIITSTDNLAIGGTLNVQASQTLSINSAKTVTMNAASTTTLNGTISGAGTLELKDTAGANLSTGGTLSAITRFNTATSNVTVPARTYGSKVELYNNTASNYSAVLGTAGSQTLTFNGDVNPLANSTGNMTLDSDTYDPTININANLDFTGTGGGTEIINAGNSTWNITGNADFTGGTLNAGTSTFSLNGANSGTQVISGSNTFYNFQASTAGNTAGRTLQFAGGSTQTVTSNWVITGYSGKVITLGSTNTTAWTVTPANAAITYASISRSTTGVLFCATYSTDGGNNTGWHISATATCAGNITISGTVYTNKNKSTNVGAGKNISLSVNGADKSSTVQTATNGLFSFSVLVAANNTLTIFIDNDPSLEANLITQTLDNTSNIVGLEMYTNKVVLRHESAGPLTNTLLDTANNCTNCGSDIHYTTSGSTANFDTAYEVIIDSGKSYTPGGNITLGDLDINGTMAMAANSLDISSNFDATGGTFTSTGTTTFSSTATTKTIISASQSFGNITFSGAGGGWQFNDDANMAGNLTVSNSDTLGNGVNLNNRAVNVDGNVAIGGGKLTAGSAAVTVAGNWVRTAGTFVANTGGVTFDAGTTGKTITSGTQAFNNLTFGNAAGDWTLQDNLTASSLSVTTGKLIDNAKTVIVNGNIDIANTVNSLASTGFWVQGASGNISNPYNGNHIRNLSIAGPGVTTTLTGHVFTGSSSTAVNSGLTIGSGTLNGAGKNLYFYNDAATNNLTINNPTMGSALAWFIYYNYNNQTLNALTFPNGFGSVRFSNQISSSCNLTAGGDLNFGNNNVYFITSATGSTQPTVYFDMSASSLTTTGILNIGATTVNGYLKLGSSTNHSVGGLAVSGTGTGNKLDFGSSTIAVSGDINFTSIAVSANASTVRMNAAATGKTITSAGQTFNNLTFNGTGGWDFQDATSILGNLIISNSDTSGNGVNFNNQAINIDGNLQMDAGKLTLGSSAVTAAGNWTINGGTQVPNTSTVTFDAGATGNTIKSSSQPFNAVVFNNAAGGWTFQDNTLVNADFTITAGTVAAAGTTLTVAGNWDSSGGAFTRGTSTVIMTGASANITTIAAGNWWTTYTFYNLTINSGANATVQTAATTNGFMVDNALVVSGVLTMPTAKQVTVDENCSLTINAGGELAGAGIFYRLTNNSSAQITNNGTISVVFRYFIDSASTAAPITATTYANLQVTNNGTSTATVTAVIGAGTLNVTSSIMLFSQSVGITLIVDNTTNNTPITMSGITVGSSGQPNRYAQFKAGSATITNTGGTIIQASDTSGDNILDLGSSAWTVAGNWTNNAKVTAGTSTVTLNGNASANQTVTSGGQAFNNLILNNTQATYGQEIIAGTLDVNGNLTVTDGNLKLDTNNPDVDTAGNVSIAAIATVTRGTGTWTFDGTAATTYTDVTASSQDIGAVVIAKTNATASNNKVTLATAAGNGLQVQTLTISANNTLDMNTGNYYLRIRKFSTTADVLTVNGTFIPGTSAVKIFSTNSTGNINIPTIPYSTLQLSGTETYDLMGNQTGANAITGSVMIDANATLNTTASNYNIDAGKDWTCLGGFTANASTVTMNTGAAVRNITSTGTSFYNLTFSNAAGAWAFLDAASIAGNLTITNSSALNNGVNFNNQAVNIGGNVALNGGKLTAGSSVITVAGGWTRTSGVFTANTSSVILGGADASTQVITGDTTFNNLTASTAGNTAGRTLQFVGASTTTVSGALTITGYAGKVMTLQSSNTTAWIINPATASVDYAAVSYSTNNGAVICATHSTDGGNNNTSWKFGSGTVCNTAPSVPASLVQKKTTDVVIPTGSWTNEASIKFSANISDIDNPDTIYLCVEKKPLGQAFLDSEDSCSSGYSYVGTAVAAALTFSGLVDGTQYHWQARVKDAGGLYSAWVQYGGNTESLSDFGSDISGPIGGVNDGSGADIDWNDGSLTQLQANWIFTDSASGVQKYEYAVQRQSDSYYWNTTSHVWQSAPIWYDNGTTTAITLTPIYLQTSIPYITSVKVTDNAGNITTDSSNGQRVLPTLSFSLSGTSVTFDNLNAGNGWTSQKSSTISTSTNAAYGYAVGAYMPNQMVSTASPTATVNNFYGTWADPKVWASEFGFGYTSNDSYVQGANRFAGGTQFAAFSTNIPGDIVADHTAAVDGSTGMVNNEQFTITYKITVPSTQAASLYATNIYYIATANY